MCIRDRANGFGPQAVAPKAAGAGSSLCARRARRRRPGFSDQRMATVRSDGRRATAGRCALGQY
eukprot:8355138-Lingulodinium_polyedra.AAC.1